MRIKKGLISLSLGIVVVGVVCSNGIALSQSEESLATSNKFYSKTKISKDIERPLLRPVIFKKGEVAKDSQKMTDVPTSSKKNEGEDSILSHLQAEKKKLQELENEYKKLEKGVTREKGSSLELIADVKKGSKAMGNGESPSGSNPAAPVTSSVEVVASIPTNGTSERGENAATKPSIPQSGKKQELSEKLAKMIKGVSPLEVAECFYKLCEYEKALQMYKLIEPSDNSKNQYVWAQYQIANCYRNMKKYDNAFSEYQKFVGLYPNNDLVNQAKWYMDDINWWKSWYEKYPLTNNPLLTASNGGEIK